MLCLGRKIGEKILDDSFTAPLSFPSPYHLPAVCTNLPLRPSLFFHSDRTHLSSQPSAKERHRQRWKQISLVLCDNHSLAITEPQRFFTTGPNLKVRKRLAHVPVAISCNTLSWKSYASFQLRPPYQFYNTEVLTEELVEPRPCMDTILTDAYLAREVVGLSALQIKRLSLHNLLV